MQYFSKILIRGKNNNDIFNTVLLRGYGIKDSHINFIKINEIATYFYNKDIVLIGITKTLHPAYESFIKHFRDETKLEAKLGIFKEGWF